MADGNAAVVIDGRALTLAEVEDVARYGRRVELSREVVRRLTETRGALEGAIGGGQTIYGVNTGFGSFAQRRVSGDALREVQRNLIRSHSAGVGALLPPEVVRSMLLLLAGSLSRGCSGVRAELVEGLVSALNAGVIPAVPETGSVGASGDLAPLAHCVLALMGEGEVLAPGGTRDSAGALREAGLRPLTLEAKEGLALINGTHLMAGEAAMLLHDARRVVDAACVACAMSIDACRATDAFLDSRVHEVRRQPGPVWIASRLRDLLRGSEIVASHQTDDPRVQDPYSLRCAPQVIGAAVDALRYVRERVEDELGAVTDNPLVFVEGGSCDVVSAGNFHGMPLAIPLDTVAIALAHIAGISERRVYYLLAASDAENPLNPHLSPVPGLHSGLMIVQYTAAACCNELVTLASPASPVNLPTSAGMEDYNSFGPRAAGKARRSLELVRSVVAIELLCAAEALEYQRPLRSGARVEAAHAAVRRVVPRLHEDRPPAPDIEAIASMIRAGDFEIGEEPHVERG